MQQLADKTDEEGSEFRSIVLEAVSQKSNFNISNNAEFSKFVLDQLIEKDQFKKFQWKVDVHDC
jgi:hypothetical protein